MAKNPFGEEPAPPQRVNPFDSSDAPLGAADRIEHAARKIRMLKSRLGAEGLTLSATRELIDELSAALDAAARAIREHDEA
jgi:hypothetical protein